MEFCSKFDVLIEMQGLGIIKNLNIYENYLSIFSVIITQTQSHFEN